MRTSDLATGPGDEPVNDTEHELLAAAIAGTIIDLRAGDTEPDNPGLGATWGAERHIRADLLAALLTGTASSHGKPPRAIKLRGARIIGTLNLEAANLTCPLLLEDCYIDEPVNLTEATAPSIRMLGCRLPSLTARQLCTTHNLSLDAATFTRGVTLSGAHIGGTLSMVGTKLHSLSGSRLTVEQNMICRHGFTASGEVRLVGAHIGGQLDLSGATLANWRWALYGDGLTVDQDLDAERLSAHGQIRLSTARIAGELRLSGANLTGSPALDADSLSVGQNMICRHGFTADGEIILRGARIAGRLDLSGAHLTSTNSPALTADGLTIEQDMICRSGRTVDDSLQARRFTVKGKISLVGSRISGKLDLTTASLANPSGSALCLQAANVADLLLLPGHRPDGDVDLTHARVGIFEDDPATWPEALCLRDFTYDSLSNQQVSVRRRLEWLARNQGGYLPQPYDQLVAAYKRAGDEQAARKVAIAKQRRRRRAYSPLSWLWYLTVGYGYRPWLAGAWALALAAVGTAVFSHAYPAHMIATSPHPPAFHAAAYALDLLLPVIGLGQKSAWQPQESAYQYWSWVLTGAGWVLTTAVVAGLTGILKRD